MSTGIYTRTLEHNRHISMALKGKSTAAWIASGSKSPHWRGDKAGYSPLHKRLYRLRGKANECKENEDKKKSMRFEWANLTGKYEDINDYRSMCKSCHAKYDKAQYNLPHMQYGL